MSAPPVLSHPFESRPHRTLVGLSLPVMASLVVEPLAGVVDTAFVERLGTASAAGLGAATALLSSFIWIFNFLGVGTQTEVARAAGEGRQEDVSAISSLALGLAATLGVTAAVAAALWSAPATAWMSGDAAVREATEGYLLVRLIGVPGSLLLFAAFGVMRGLQDMRSPMWIAGAMSLANVVLDPILIFGWGPVPALGIAGAAWATTASQLAGGAAAVALVVSQVGWTTRFDLHRVWALFAVGRDMVMRTGALLLFMLVATRFALQLGEIAGAAHQAIRQCFMLLAFLLDAYAATTQSLVAWFLGAGQLRQARRVAVVGMQWALATGALLSLALWAGEGAVATLLVPPEARAAFASAWPVFVAIQVLSAVSFLTDGLHWGTGDFAWLRNGMIVATAVGLLGLAALPREGATLAFVWWVTAAWLAVRSLFGVVRIWPGVGNPPLGRSRYSNAVRS